MTAPPPAAAAAAPEARDPWERLGWVMWAPWMLFLVFPLGAAWMAESLLERLVGTALVLAFAATYAVGFVRLPRVGRSSREPVLVLFVLVVLVATTSPVVGVSALTFLPFVQSFAMFALPRPWQWWFCGTVLVVTTVALTVWESFEEWGSLGFILVAVTLGTGAGRLMEEQGERYAAVRDGLAISAERERVARDVHDVLGHSLTVVSVKADLAARLVDADPERARAELADIQALSRQALAEIRATVGGLRAASLTDELAAARVALVGAGIEPDLPADDQVVDPRYRTVAGWVLREAVTNVVRHSGARHCEVRLSSTTLAVRDDGRGVAGAAEGNGLRGLRERVEGTGGRLAVGPGLGGAGTTLEVSW